jgi:hypothetical protein
MEPAQLTNPIPGNGPAVEVDADETAIASIRA